MKMEVRASIEWIRGPFVLPTLVLTSTASLALATARDAGAIVVWHCHVGADELNDTVRRAWRFLSDEVAPPSRYILSRRAYLWDGLDEARLRVIQPSIDAFSPKNQALDDPTTEAILAAAGVLEGEPARDPEFTRHDGGTDVVKRRWGSGPTSASATTS